MNTEMTAPSVENAVRISDITVSLVVDDVFDHLYKADLLIRSLKHNAAIEPDRVIIQHTARVPPASLAPFRVLGARIREIEPFLDGLYCNKIRQLEFSADLKLDVSGGLLLLDVDVAFAAPLSPFPRGVIAGKIVDAPNPPVHVLKRIFAAAGVPPPATVACDWNCGDTFSTNFNGGVLYIPTQLVDSVGPAWKRFASFLSSSPQLFDDDAQRTHIDQIAFALAVTSTGSPFTHLRANSNFPTHSDALPRTYDLARPIEVLHYHWDFDDFGFIAPTSNADVVCATARSLDAVAQTCGDPAYYLRFKQGRAKRAYGSISTSERPILPNIDEWIKLNERRPKLVFHSGTPKTGTKSLQFLMHENRDLFALRGIWYPDTQGHFEPKHQFLVQQLISADHHGFDLSIAAALRTMPEATRLILFSTEGLFNHWFDFGVESRTALRALAERFEVEFLACFRDPVDFATALYLQYTKNPPVHPCYGLDISFEEMLDHAWFKRHLDYLGFVDEIEETIGQGHLRVIDYSSDVVRDILTYLGAANLAVSSARRNTSIGRQAFEMLRIVNRSHLEPQVRSQIVAHISQIDELLGEKRRAFVPTYEAAQRIRQLTSKDTEALKARHRELAANAVSV